MDEIADEAPRDGFQTPPNRFCKKTAENLSVGFSIAMFDYQRVSWL
jgi:hypothetical protein